MKRYKTGILSAILPTAMAVLALALSSCVKQELPGGGGDFGDGYASLTLELKLPGEFTLPTTRALTDEQQNDINRALVLVFQNDKVTQAIKAARVATTGDAGIKKMTVNGVKTSHSESDKYDIMVLGNDSTPENSLINYVGKTKAEIRTANHTFFGNSSSGKYTDKEFIMWGEMNDVLIHPISNTFQLNMLRPLARVDIGLGEYDPSTGTWPGLNYFTITDVHLIAKATGYHIIPDPKNVGVDGNVTAASDGGMAVGVSTEATYQGADEITDGKYSKSTIFIAESASTELHPVKLIIGGLYQGQQTYYRVDLLMPIPPIADKKFKDILRNHLYRISVTKILAPGYSTREEAAALPPLNKVFVTRVESIDEGQHGDILFDENSSISTDASVIYIYGKPDGKTKYTFATVRALFNKETINKQVSIWIGNCNSPISESDDNRLTEYGTNGFTEYGILKSGEDMVLEAILPSNTCSVYFEIEVGRLKKLITCSIFPPIDAHFDFMPFDHVASITISDPKPWLTLSNNRTYVKSEQQSASITSNAGGRAVVHFDENTATTGAPRTAEVMILRDAWETFGTQRVIFEQLNLNGMVVGLFGGAKDNQGYTKQLAVESVDENYERNYPDGSSAGSPDRGLVWGFKNTLTNNSNNIELGRDGTIALAKREGSGITPPFTIHKNYAARYCYDKNRDTNGNGTIDDAEVLWYLPAQNQLMAVWIAHNGLSNPISSNFADRHWSTKEHNSVDSWSVSFKYGSTGSNGKFTIYRVRCVRDL